MERSISLTPEFNFTVVKVVAVSLISAVIKIGLIGILLFFIGTEGKKFHENQIIPTALDRNEDEVLKKTKKALLYLNCPTEKLDTIGNSIVISSKVSGISPVLLVALMYSESTFDMNAKSNKNYKGLMQTKSSTKIAEVDTLHGAMVLKDKLRIAKGDYLTALSLYKGGRNKVAVSQAKKVLALYNDVNRRV